MTTEPLTAARLAEIRTRADAVCAWPPIMSNEIRDAIDSQRDIPDLLGEVERAREVIAGLVKEYSLFSGDRCRWCGVWPSSDYGQTYHLPACEFMVAAAYIRPDFLPAGHEWASDAEEETTR